MADQTLGNLTVTWLTKYIRQQLENSPITSFDAIKVGVLEVTQKLVVDKDLDFKTADTFKFIGSQGFPPFTNAWVNYGAPYSNAGYLKRADGWVELVGVVKSGTVGSSAFTLPPGYRPVSTKSRLTLSNGTTGRVDIGSDGTVTPLSPSSNLSVVLDGLHFKAA